MFNAIVRGEAAPGRPVSAATLHRIHATLRAALNGAVRVALISVNPGRWPELPKATRPRPQVWTPALTDRWQTEGWRPTVGVWTVSQTAQFLSQVRGHRLYALFHLVALRGLRRGEAAGLRWSDLDLDAGTLAVSGQLQQLGGRMVSGPPKSDAGRRVIALDKTTIAALREHRFRHQAERAAAGPRWTETGYVFTTRAEHAMGYIGCSMGENTAQGYAADGGTACGVGMRPAATWCSPGPIPTPAPGSCSTSRPQCSGSLRRCGCRSVCSPGGNHCRGGPDDREYAPALGNPA